MDNFLSNEIDISTLQPPTVKNLKDFEEIANVENKNFNKVRMQIIDIFNNRFVHLANEQGIARWEKMLEIQRRRTDTLEERRQRVLAKINNKLPYTMRTLKQLLNSLCGENNYGIFLDPEEFELHLELYSKINDVVNLKNTLEAMIPLNIWLHFVYAIKVPPIKIAARKHIYPVNYPITNVAISNNDDVGFVGSSNVEIPVSEKKYRVVYPITGMAFSY